MRVPLLPLTWLRNQAARCASAQVAGMISGSSMSARSDSEQSHSTFGSGLGAAPRSGLLDLREVFSSDAQEKLSFVPKPGADGKTVLLQMCARCHDGRSDPMLAKSRFNVLKLAEMSRSEKDLAITRISSTDGKVMPPWRVGSLTSEGRQAAIAELQK